MRRLKRGTALLQCSRNRFRGGCIIAYGSVLRYKLRDNRVTPGWVRSNRVSAARRMRPPLENAGRQARRYGRLVLGEKLVLLASVVDRQ